MHKDLRQTAVLAAALWTIVMSGTAWPCAVKEQFGRNGSSPLDAVSLDSKVGSSLKLYLSTEADCFVSMDVALPTRIALLLRALETRQSRNSFNVRLLRRVDKG